MFEVFAFGNFIALCFMAWIMFKVSQGVENEEINETIDDTYSEEARGSILAHSFDLDDIIGEMAQRDSFAA